MIGVDLTIHIMLCGLVALADAVNDFEHHDEQQSYPSAQSPEWSGSIGVDHRVPEVISVDLYIQIRLCGLVAMVDAENVLEPHEEQPSYPSEWW